MKFAQCGEDLWECILEECQKVRHSYSLLNDLFLTNWFYHQGSINSRINILHFLDSLCETCQQLKSRPVNQNDDSSSKFLYIEYLARDLPKIIELVAPDGRQGLPNLSSTKQVCLQSSQSSHMTSYLSPSYNHSRYLKAGVRNA